MTDSPGLAVFALADAIVTLLGVDVPIRQLECGCYALQVDVTQADRVAEGQVVVLLAAAPGTRIVGRIRRGYRLLGTGVHRDGCPEATTATAPEIPA